MYSESLSAVQREVLMALVELYEKKKRVRKSLRLSTRETAQLGI